MEYSNVYSYFRNKSILITGASGFVGRSVVDSFLSYAEFATASIKLTCVSREVHRTSSMFKGHQNLQFLQWDLRHPYSGGKLDIDFVIHCGDGAFENSELDIECGEFCTPTTNLLDALGNKRKLRLIYLSSGSIYQANDTSPMTLSETSLMKSSSQATNYQRTKIDTEKLLASRCTNNNADYVLARLFSFIGPHLPRSSHFAIGNFIQDCIDRKAIVILGNGLQVRSYMHSVDLGNWILEILARGASGESYNIGGDEPISMYDLANRMQVLLDIEHAIEIHDSKRESFSGSDYYVPSVEKAKRDLGLRVSMGLDKSITSTINEIISTEG